MDPNAARAEIAAIKRRKCSREGDRERLAELRAALREWNGRNGF